MKKIMLAAIIFLTSIPVMAKLNVVTTYPIIGDITEKIGGDSVRVRSLSSGTWDPHYVVPKPSLIAMVRGADLLIINGAELEIGWLPPLVRDSHNSAVKPGSPGFLDLSVHVKKIEVPVSVSRAHGDVHPSGNPHFMLDPAVIPVLAGVIADRLSLLDVTNAPSYRRNLAAFRERWAKNLARWDAAMTPLKGSKVIQYHRLFNYFFDRYGITAVMEIEPLPGIPPTSMHLEKILARLKDGEAGLIITDVYHDRKAAQIISSRSGVPWIVLPHDINPGEKVTDTEKLFDEITGRMTK